MRFLLRGAVAAALAIPVAGTAATWDLDPAHTSVQFSVRHMMVSNVRGEFGKVSGTVQSDEADPTRSGDISATGGPDGQDGGGDK